VIVFLTISALTLAAKISNLKDVGDDCYSLKMNRFTIFMSETWNLPISLTLKFDKSYIDLVKASNRISPTPIPTQIIVV
jgi:hypothetical protein